MGNTTTETSSIHNRAKFDFYTVVYTNKKGEQICKPFEDDENGELKKVAILTVYGR